MPIITKGWKNLGYINNDPNTPYCAHYFVVIMNHDGSVWARSPCGWRMTGDGPFAIDLVGMQEAIKPCATCRRRTNYTPRDR